MKTVLVSFYAAFPPECGAANVTYNVAKFIPGEKHLIQFNTGLHPIPDGLDLNLINIGKNLSSNFFNGCYLSFQFSKIIKIIKRLAPDFIILEGAAWSFYYSILIYLLRLSKVKAKIIYHAHNIEYLLRKQKNNIIIAELTRWTEGLICKNVDLLTAVSEEDALNFNRYYGVRPLVFPNGVDLDIFNSVDKVQLQEIKLKYGLEDKIVLFMGLTDFKPNKEAIDFLINKVFPKVVKEFSEAKLAVIGGKLKFKKKWLINPGVIPFEEVPIFVKSCDVCVAPIFSGSGTRVKILEYMAAGKPVISTTKGCEGISATPDKELLIADDDKNFIQAILRLLNEPDYGQKIGCQGKELVQRKFSWQKIIKDFCSQLNRFSL